MKHFLLFILSYITPLILLAEVIDFDLITRHSNNYDTISADKNFTFKKNSVLASGTWAKISIKKSGVYKIDYKLMKNIASSLGVSIDNIDPRRIALFGQKGGMLPEINSKYDSDDLEEIPIEVQGENDGKFDKNDYIIVYGEGADTWNIGVDNKTLSHNKNIYTDKTFLFITIKENKGKRVQLLKEITSTPTKTYNSYNSFNVHELDDVNLHKSGKQWFGERFERKNKQTFSLKFPNRDINEDVSIKIRIASLTKKPMSLSVKANDSDLYSFEISEGTNYESFEKNKSIKSNKENIDIDFNLSYNGDGECLLDYIEVNAISKLIADDKQYIFQNIDTKNNYEVVEFKIKNPSNIKSVWNISNPKIPKKIKLNTSGEYAYFKEHSTYLEKYILISEKDFFNPKLEGSVPNQNLHAKSAVDYIIISHKSLISSAKKLAEFHRNRGLAVELTDLELIYNEFSAGRQDLVAIRQYVRMMYKKGGNPSKLKFLLLFGDASYDFKDRIANNTNLVPSYQSYSSFSESTSFVTDDFYGFMDDNEGGNIISGDLIDIAIGRIPANTNEDAENIINKIQKYHSKSSFGTWRNNIQFISDDIVKEKWEYGFMNDSEKLSDSLLTSTINSKYNHQKVYLDTYKKSQTISGDNYYPKAHKDLMQNIQSGNLISNYFGHGSEVSWSEEGLFNINDIKSLSNINNLPLFIVVTCNFFKYDNPLIYTGGEELLLYKKGGAIALIATSREIGLSLGEMINEKIFKFLLPTNKENYVSIGEALRRSKNSLPHINTRNVALAGDPAIMLAYPKRSIKIKSINNKEISDTIKSLMKIHVEAEVFIDDAKDINFNGIANSTVYDKKKELSSLGNNNFGVKIPYWTQNNIIFKGQSTVKNGTFAFDFIVPKDINYSFGKGKISLYANNSKTDATGSNTDITIGGIDNYGHEYDLEGPDIKMYLNSSSFKNGDISSSSPLFIVSLQDESGINTVGNGIGHDLKMIISSDKMKEEYILNEFYESNIDDFTSGIASYQLFGLEQGSYTIELFAWDTFNNSSTSKLYFSVISDNKIAVKNVRNYPNPFKNETNFTFLHNCINENIIIKIDIYTISGVNVKTITKHDNYTSFVADNIVWDGRSNNGKLLSSGIYIYTINIMVENGSKSSTQHVNKLMIVR